MPEPILVFPLAKKQEYTLDVLLVCCRALTHTHTVSSCPNECVGGLWVCGWKCFLTEIPHRHQQNMQFEVMMQKVIQERPEWSHLRCLGKPSLQSQYTIGAFLTLNLNNQQCPKAKLPRKPNMHHKTHNRIFTD